MSGIEAITAREILDSRGNPTVEAELRTKAGATGVARAPSGASTGSREARELRDAEQPRRYRGKGVLGAVGNVRERIAPRLLGLEVAEQAEIDRALRELDGTPDKSGLGANAILAVSAAAARAAAAEAGQPLFRRLAATAQAAGMAETPFAMPVPMMNLINGGAHANNGLDLQEFLVLPVGAADMREAVRYGAEVYHALQDLLSGKGLATAVGDEGGFAPRLPSNEAAVELILEATRRAGLRAPQDLVLGLDAASTEFYRDGRYVLASERRQLSCEDWIDCLADWVRRYPIATIEDGMAEDDWDGWRELTRRLGKHVQLVGDDLFVTNADTLREGRERGAANAILVKPNQIGTVSETLEALRTAKEIGYAAIVSHRSGETEDTFIADLAVAVASGQIKTGAPCRSERVAKYNRLLRIEELLGDARYAGAGAVARLAAAPSAPAGGAAEGPAAEQAAG